MTTTRLSEEAYLEHIGSESQRFYETLAAVDGAGRVPTCPAWNALDLMAHLREVQTAWGRIVLERLREEEAVAALAAPPPPREHEDRVALAAAGRAASHTLVDALREASPDTPVWTWSEDHRVAFVTRRQAHEATVHRLDAELTLAPDGSARTPIDAMLAADGVDEVLRVMYGYRPGWGTISPLEGRMVRVVATDTGTTWLVSLARLTGTDPEGLAHDEPDIHVAEHDPADGTVRPQALLSGAAEDLYCRLWHRPSVGDLHRTGDNALLAEVEAVLAAPLD